MFRTYHNSTSFSRRMTRYADIYTSSLENLLNYSVDFHFFPRRNFLPHEQMNHMSLFDKWRTVIILQLVLRPYFRYLIISTFQSWQSVQYIHKVSTSILQRSVSRRIDYMSEKIFVNYIRGILCYQVPATKVQLYFCLQMKTLSEFLLGWSFFAKIVNG